MTQVAILWHMHQPFYKDLVTREHILPWVRLHALKDYYGMVALLREFPEVRVTFNLVPSLLVQLEEFALGRARERHLEAGLKAATDLTPADTAFIVEEFFHANPQHMIGAFPRYVELLALRGGAQPPAGGWQAAAARFSADDLRDLQVLHKLAWIDPLYRDGDSRVVELSKKGRQYTEDDKRLLREVELEILNRVIPEYRDAASRGQIELSTSPFYHPILPLLCDTNVYLRTHPESPLPRHRFQRPEDAAEQLARAVAQHERLFGHKPAGLWPSEGSVSDAMVPLVADAGFQWMATDELVLGRTTGLNFSRDSSGHLLQPEQLYKPRIVRAGGKAVTCAFRDHVLSDLIGFTYAGWAADAAASDFCDRLVEAGRRYRERRGGEEAVIPIILDGENAWEHFPGGGRPFLRALYGRLSQTPDLRTVTMSEACRGARDELAGIFPGSWIGADFYIWIGHADDHVAWGQLAEARAALDAPGSIDPDALRQAREEVLVAEGSDWFWWYGDDHSSPHDPEFDELFRRHLRNAYRLLEQAIPDDLFVSNISSAVAAAAVTEPTAFIHPTLDGEETSYFEWLAAGGIPLRSPGGTMQAADRQVEEIVSVHFGFDADRLYVRVDGRRPMAGLLAEGLEVSLQFLQPPGLRFSVRQTQGRLITSLSVANNADPSAHRRSPDGSSRAAAGTVLEMELPFQEIGAAVGTLLSFFVVVSEAGGAERERHPAHRPVEARMPDAWFEGRNWSA